MVGIEWWDVGFTIIGYDACSLYGIDVWVEDG